MAQIDLEQFFATYQVWHDEFAALIEATDKMVNEIRYAAAQVEKSKERLKNEDGYSSYYTKEIRDNERYITLMVKAVNEITEGNE